MLPPLGILAVPGSAPAFVALVHALGAWCSPRAARADDASPVAWLASSPSCPGLARVAVTGRPYAIWIDDRQALERAAALSPPPRIVVTADPVLAAVDGGSSLFPEHGLDLRDYRPIAPGIRRRWRSRLGLPPTLIVSAFAGSPGVLPADLLPTALALASVVVATGPHLGEALAWAAPCVSDDASAGSVGARHGEVVVGAPEALEGLAVQVAADEGLAAALSGAGRRLVERRADRHRPARQVAEALGLVGRNGHVATRSTGRVLDSLGTPDTSPLRSRVEALVAARR